MVYLKSFFFNSLFYVGTGILVIVMGPVLLFPSGYARALARFWGYMTYLLLSMIGITQNVSGDRQLTRQVLYAVKHQSAWETIILCWLLAAPAFVLKRFLVCCCKPHFWCLARFPSLLPPGRTQTPLISSF